MKRVAVYFTGHIRNMNELWPHYKKIFQNSEKVTFDFFFTIWDVKNVNDVMKVEKEDEPVTPEFIQSFCPEAKSIVILKSSDFILPEYLKDYKPNLVSQMYGIYQAFSNVPDTYDYYMKMRCDLYFFTTNFFTNIFDTPANLYLLDTCWYKNKNFPAFWACNDFLWIGDYKISFAIANLYNSLHEYSNIDSFEKVLADFLQKQTFVSIHNFVCEVNLERRTRGYEMWLEESRFMTEKRKQIETAYQS